jgi:hypothetical protein
LRERRVANGERMDHHRARCGTAGLRGGAGLARKRPREVDDLTLSPWLFLMSRLFSTGW